MKIRVLFVIALAAVMLFAGVIAAHAGAIMTTNNTGELVNGNIYPKATDVYGARGGPQLAPPGACTLKPLTAYVHFITNPSVTEVYNQDWAVNRIAYTNALGYVASVSDEEVKIGGKTYGAHKTAPFLAYAGYGAIVVQEWPFSKTSNPGGEYKDVWIELEHYSGSLYEVGNPRRYSDQKYWKTDNFKVRQGKTTTPPYILGDKFHDANGNGVKDADEVNVGGWGVTITEPTGISYLVSTPFNIMATPSGTWNAAEALPSGVQVTATSLDGTALTPSAEVNVEVAGTDGETHRVVWGNVGLGSATVSKVLDLDADGEAEAGEPGVAGWWMRLTGTTLAGATVDLTQETGTDGTTTFTGLLPGNYTVEELWPTGTCWQTAGAKTQNFSVTSTLDGATISGSDVEIAFANYCVGTVGYHTKGYYQLENPNGNPTITDGDIANLNGRDPYDDPTEYWETPFADRYEFGEFVNSPVSASPHRFQLAQQLATFILNGRHYLESPDTFIQLPDGSWVKASDLEADAIAVWQSGTDAERSAWILRLTLFNESDAVAYIKTTACPVVY